MTGNKKRTWTNFFFFSFSFLTIFLFSSQVYQLLERKTHIYGNPCFEWYKHEVETLNQQLMGETSSVVCTATKLVGSSSRNPRISPQKSCLFRPATLFYSKQFVVYGARLQTYIHSPNLYFSSSQTPWLMLPEDEDEDTNSRCFFSLEEQKIYKIKSISINEK